MTEATQERAILLTCRRCGAQRSRGAFLSARGCPSCGGQRQWHGAYTMPGHHHLLAGQRAKAAREREDNAPD